MPSENDAPAHGSSAPESTTLAQVMAVAEAPVEAFHTALVKAIEDVRGYLAAHRPAGSDEPAHEVAAQLGAFGAGRIDPARFAGLITAAETLDAARLHRVERALAHLEALEARGAELYRTRVGPGEDLRDGVAHALARIGTVFGMIRVVAAARSGRPDPVEPEDFVDGLDARRWGRTERRMAPPLVVEVDGADLEVGGLDAFLDGGLELALVVGGKAPPAPLAAAIRPGVYVVQTTDPATLAPAMAFEGPALTAVVPEGAAEFVHDPTAGPDYATRLRIVHAPDRESLEPLGAWTVFRQGQDLDHLQALAAGGRRAGAENGRPGAGPGAVLGVTSGVGSATGEGAPVAGAAQPTATASAPPAAAAPEPTPADRLAGWLLQQAGLE